MKSPLLFFKGKEEVWKKVIKCVIAYEIGIILILIPKFVENAGNPPYLVPLGTLFFNASGTAGNQIAQMVLNILVMLPAAIWSGVISYLCTIYNQARLTTHPNLYSNGPGVIAGISFAICVFVIAYYRLKYPRLYIPALQGFTLPFFVLTKGIYDTQYNIMNVVGTFYPILIGGGVALLVNLLLWPETAAKSAEKAIGSSIESIKSVLSFVHEDLLKNDDSGVMTGDISANSTLQNLNQKLQKDIASMKIARQDAKYELIVSYYNPKSYKPLAHTLVRISEDILGFSLAIKREVRIMLEKKVKAHLEGYTKRVQQSTPAFTTTYKQNMVPSLPMVPISNSALVTPEKNDHFQDSVLSGDTLLHGREYKNIDRLQSSIQPALKRFLNTCILTLDQIENDLIEHHAISVKKPTGDQKTHSTSKINLLSALAEFKAMELNLQQEYDQADTVPSEDRFLVFTVIFTLVEFGKELVRLQSDTEELLRQKVSSKFWFKRIYLPRVHLRTWLKKGVEHLGNQTTSEKVILEHQDTNLNDQTKKTGPNYELSRIVTNQLPTDDYDEEEEEPDTADDDDNSFTLSRRVSRIASRIETNPRVTKATDEEIMKEEEEHELEINELETIPLQQAQGKHFWNKYLYALDKWFQYGPTRYAIKLTLIMQLLSLMAFLPIEGVNDLYNNNHGQWALLSAMVVVNYTVGSTAIQCFYRVVATVIGAVCAYIALLAGRRNEIPYATAVLVFVFAIPMWYLLLGSKYPRIGFISILTMAVITSTGYTNSYDESIFGPVWKRSVTAFFAIIVVMLVDQLIWPVWARKNLRVSLADLLIATGIQYSRVVSLVCQEHRDSYRYITTSKECEKNQKRLENQMRIVHEMLVLAAGEPRFTKGPFPIKEYSEILEHERNILHWIKHIQKAQAFISESVRRTIMMPLNSYRKEMAATVHLYLFTLACSLRTKSALPASLPSAEIARRILQTRQTLSWKKNYEDLLKLSKQSADQQSAEHQVFWHTYAAGSTEVVIEQEAMGEIVARLMGQHVFQAATRDWIQNTPASSTSNL